MNDAIQFDVIVIGAGPGGYVAAIRCAQLGLRTGLVERSETFGGTCLNVGCIPSKALLDSSHRYFEITQRAEPHGIVVENVRLDLATMMARKDQVVRTLASGLASLFEANKVVTFRGHASLRSVSQVAVAADDEAPQLLVAKHVVLATGSVPAQLPDLPFDHELVVDSTDALCFDVVPHQLVVVGGGAVGLELASVWARLGAKVTVVEMMDQLLPGCDRQVSRMLHRILTGQGIDVMTQSSVVNLEKVNGRGRVMVKSGQDKTTELSADKILVAVGRRPFALGLGLEDIGVVTEDKTGQILVNDNFMTNIAGIYAVGDVVGAPMLAHKAEAEGIAVAEIIAGKPGQVNYEAIPNVVYTAPEVAVVGKTQQQLRNAGIQYEAGVFHFRSNGRALAADSREGFVKILADRRTDRVLGVHIIGPWASDLIAEAVEVMEFGGSAEDIARTVHAHPTLSEVVGEAAMAVGNRSIHSVPRKP